MVDRRVAQQMRKATDVPEANLFPNVTHRSNKEGPYSAVLGKTTTGTCLDFACCSSEDDHYRVPMLYSTSAGSH
ncbi:hypothetical protein F2Q69_00035098 [Brassica cretica]|uniref:Uncharacterized protein n=1 Tax=Brassica cretica TaxID=69181 RepID=A0A8S9SCV7_BRACR|nr:hypothetical protein F2Q69_00035098 [Brassica cretica]